MAPRCFAVHDDLSQCVLREGHAGEHRKSRGITPTTPFRIPSDVLAAAKARAKAEGVTLTAVVVTALRAYGAGATRNVMPPPQHR